MADKTIVITGGAGGLGKAIARLHLAMGDRVWALDLRSNPEMDDLLAEHDRLKFIPCDISDTGSVQDAITPCLAGIGRIDLIYSCAGIYSAADKVQLPETDLEKAGTMFNINAVGFLRVIQTLFANIQDGTHILCVTSEAGSIGANKRSIEYNYCMSKAAENMACALLRKHFEEAGQNTRVICIHPGWLRTQMGGEEAAKHPELSVSPEDSARGIVDIALGAEQLPKDSNYMDYQRTPYPW